MPPEPDAHADALLAAHAADVDAFLRDEVPRLLGWPDAPAEAVRPAIYALEGPGKRLRPALVLEAARACGGDASAALPAAAAVELVHTFSLVHDDLPAMDDDDLRRGRPTVHKAFDEAAGVLAGDMLAVASFELLALAYAATPPLAVVAIAELARATGPCGMIGGQALDIAGERRRLDLKALQRIHTLKTGSLLAASCALGGIVAGGSAGSVDKLRRFGRDVGLAFQIADDLLDVVATADALGKATGKDAAAGKNTYPALIGIDASRRLADALVAASCREVEALPEPAGLRLLAGFAVARRR